MAVCSSYKGMRRQVLRFTKQFQSQARHLTTTHSKEAILLISSLDLAALTVLPPKALASPGKGLHRQTLHLIPDLPIRHNVFTSSLPSMPKETRIYEQIWGFGFFVFVF